MPHYGKRGTPARIIKYIIEIGSMQLLAKLLLVAPPIDLCGRLGLDALMCGATEVITGFPMGLV